MPKITELFAFVAEEAPGQEGLMAARAPNGDWFPLVANILTTVGTLASMAKAISEASGKPYRCLRFELVGEFPIVGG